MNLELLDPFAKTVPDHVDSVLSYGVEDATVCCFDKRGTYLAVGYATGVVVIWDFVTRGIGRVIDAHARGITALSWAKGGRQLLSASHDHRLHLWALEPPRPELIRVVCLDSPIISALMYPGGQSQALALTADGVVHLVDLKECEAKPLLSSFERMSPTTSASHVGNPSPAKKSRSTVGDAVQPAAGVAGAVGGGCDPSSLPAVLCMALDRRGPSMCLGTANGIVVVVDTLDGTVLNLLSVIGCSKVKQLDFSRDGKWMLVNSGDRVIRMLERDSTTGRSVHDFQDVVNRTRWQCCRFTGDSEYIAGGSRAEATCSIYVWTVAGNLVTRLEGPQMSLLSLARHPVRPFIAAALTNGKVQLWGTTHTANWTAFATDFEELEENVEYVEKEDEFDVVVDCGDPEGRKRKAEKEQEEEEVVVSIETIDPVGAWGSDSDGGENGGGPFYLSTEPGAALREGWYDLEVQTAKRAASSSGEGGDGAGEGGAATTEEGWRSVKGEAADRRGRDAVAASKAGDKGGGRGAAVESSSSKGGGGGGGKSGGGGGGSGSSSTKIGRPVGSPKIGRPVGSGKKIGRPFGSGKKIGRPFGSGKKIGRPHGSTTTNNSVDDKKAGADAQQRGLGGKVRTGGDGSSGGGGGGGAVGETGGGGSTTKHKKMRPAGESVHRNSDGGVRSTRPGVSPVGGRGRGRGGPGGAAGRGERGGVGHEKVEHRPKENLPSEAAQKTSEKRRREWE